MKPLGSVQVKLGHVAAAGLVLVVLGLAGFGWFFINARKTPEPEVVRGQLVPKHRATVYGDSNVWLGESRSVFADGNQVYISDTSNHRVVVLDYEGKFLFKFGDNPQGEWPGMQFPYGVTVAEGKIYVADAGSMKIGTYDMAGNFLSYFAEETLRKPINIVYRDQRFYVTDVLRQQIVIVDIEGQEVFAFGRYGKNSNPGEFNYPNGLAVDSDGLIYVADTNNARIQVFTEDGEFITSWLGFAAPMNIALDRDNNLYVTDPIANRVSVICRDGVLSRTITDVPGERAATTFSLPSGVFIDDEQTLFISDTGNRRLVIYGLTD